MNKLFLGISGILMAAQVSAMSLKPLTQLNLVADLSVFHLQQHSGLSNLNIRTGLVGVDSTRHQIVLELEGDSRVRVEVPIKSTTVGGCQETIYFGEKGQNFADGIHQSVKVIDNSTNICEMYPMAMTVVEYSYTGGLAGFLENHVMEGSPLTKNLTTAKLTNFNFQANTALAEKDIYEGSVEIDELNQSIHLNLLAPVKCPKGAFCIVSMFKSIDVTLPLESFMSTRCGTDVYTSKIATAFDLNDAPAKLVVIDHSRSRCFPKNNALNVTVELEIHGFINEKHNILGSATL